MTDPLSEFATIRVRVVERNKRASSFSRQGRENRRID
jgi:hypothetical protein